VNEALPTNSFKQALVKNGDDSDRRALSGRPHVETMVVYHPLAPGVPVDGNYVGTSIMLLLPTSRVTMKLVSSSPIDNLVIDTNYFSTAMDRTVLVYGARRLLQCFTKTKTGQDIVETEIAPMPGMKPLNIDSTTEEIEDRIRAVGSPHFHAAGTCALGIVLDTELKVKGVQGLRVVGASVFPTSIGGHPQVTLYGIAEMAVEMISGVKA
jgi:choline dehydrogenase-like flavoprotein